MKAVTIADLKIDPTQKVGNEQKKQLIKIIEEEFQNQTTVQSIVVDQQRDAAISEYRKTVNFSSLRAKYQRVLDKKIAACRALELAETEFHLLGLDVEGHVYSVEYHEKNLKVIEATKKLQEKIRAVAEVHLKPANYKNKIIARVLLATNAGEIAVILREILGNGVIPSMTQKELTALPAPVAAEAS